MSNKKRKRDYDELVEMLEAFGKGDITEEEWKDYCRDFLMNDPKWTDSVKRMKEHDFAEKLSDLAESVPEEWVERADESL
tara:strand:+ start:94261 stop:94500 length:240 start_codon:yes stop_codon:yes gene_type:complete